MDALRISLLIVGGLIVLAIYLYGRRHLQVENRDLDLPRKTRWLRLFRNLMQRRAQSVHPSTRAAPVVSPDMVDAADLDALEKIVPARNASAGDVDEVSMIVELTSEQIAPAGEQLFIALTIMGADDTKLKGEAIAAAVAATGFHLTPAGIFHFDVEDAHGYKQALLGLANILEPGTFDSAQMNSLVTPGLVLYLHLPGPLEARQAFDKLIEAGQQLADALGAELCDETRSALTRQTIGHLREKVEAFRFKQKMTQIKRHRQ